MTRSCLLDAHGFLTQRSSQSCNITIQHASSMRPFNFGDFCIILWVTKCNILQEKITITSTNWPVGQANLIKFIFVRFKIKQIDGQVLRQSNPVKLVGLCKHSHGLSWLHHLLQLPKNECFQNFKNAPFQQFLYLWSFWLHLKSPHRQVNFNIWPQIIEL